MLLAIANWRSGHVLAHNLAASIRRSRLQAARWPPIVTRSENPDMRPSRIAIALVLALIGLVWIGQGIGMIGGSAMTGSSFWAVVGLVLVGLAGLVVAWERRPSTRA
jgi:fatty acid desaturase